MASCTTPRLIANLPSWAAVADTTPSRPIIAASTECPFERSTTIETIAVRGKYVVSIFSPGSKSSWCCLTCTTLQRLGFIPRCAHPNVALFIGGQDHRHGFRMDRLD